MAKASIRETSTTKTAVRSGFEREPESRQGLRVTLRDAGLVFVIALMVRLIYFLQVRHCVLFQCPAVDARDNYDLAVLFARGCLLAPPDQAYWQPPFYPAVLAGWMHVVGFGVIRMKLVGFVFGAVNCALVYALGARVFDRRIGLIAGIAAALYGPMVYFDGELLTPTLQTFLILASILLLFRATDRRSLGLFALTGLVFGFAVITRPDISLFLPVAVFWAFLVLRKQVRAWKLVAACGILIVCSVLPIVPLAIRNLGVAHDYVLISSNGGINFWIGNNPNAPKTEEARPGPAWEEIVRMPLLDTPSLTESGQSAWFVSRVLQFIRTQPGRFAVLEIRKLGQYFTAIERRRNLDLYFYRRYSPFYSMLIWRVGSFAFPFGIMFPLALFGVLRMKWDSRRKLILGLLITQCLITVAFFVSARYRMTAIPAFLLFAAYGAVELRAVAKSRLWRQAATPLAIAGVALIFTNLNVSGMDTNRRWMDAESHFYMGRGYLSKHKPSLACAEFRRAIALDPKMQNAYLYYAMTLQRTGQSDEARRQALLGLKLCPTSRDANTNCGNVLMGIGDLWGALRCFQTATPRDPWSCAMLVELAHRAEKKHDPVLCFAAYQTIACLTPGFAEAQQHADEIRLALERTMRESFSPKEASAMIRTLRQPRENYHVNSFFDPPQAAAPSRQQQ